HAAVVKPLWSIDALLRKQAVLRPGRTKRIEDEGIGITIPSNAELGALQPALPEFEQEPPCVLRERRGQFVIVHRADKAAPALAVNRRLIQGCGFTRR
ncbi:MAG TPA: hypothetical protein VGC46_15130, partial [Allosphingosinicella sp.]